MFFPDEKLGCRTTWSHHPTEQLWQFCYNPIQSFFIHDFTCLQSLCDFFTLNNEYFFMQQHSLHDYFKCYIILYWIKVSSFSHPIFFILIFKLPFIFGNNSKQIMHIAFILFIISQNVFHKWYHTIKLC